MVRYLGPKVKKIRRLGLLPGLTRKLPKNKIKTPGQHGKSLFLRSKRLNLSDDYRLRLLEKQKVRFNYGVTEKQLISYFKEAKRRKEPTGNALLSLVETRLDCILFRLGFAASIPAARQLVSHRHIVVNDHCVNIASFQCRPNDKIQVKTKPKSELLLSSNFEKQQQKRSLVERRIKRIQFAKSRLLTLLPKHLEIGTEQFSLGKVQSVIKRKDVLIRVNELKIVEYYSR